jgi:hypothetical protein
VKKIDDVMRRVVGAVDYALAEETLKQRIIEGASLGASGGIGGESGPGRHC